MKAGQQAGEMTLRWGEGEGKLLEVPWPQVTASKLRPDDLHTFSAGGRGSHRVLKAIKGNENSKHLAKMSPWVKRGVCKEGQRGEWAYVSAGS